MARTFLPTLRDLVRRICVYLTKHIDTIKAGAGSEQVAALDALQQACSNFLEAYPEPVPPA